MKLKHCILIVSTLAVSTSKNNTKSSEKKIRPLASLVAKLYVTSIY